MVSIVEKNHTIYVQRVVAAIMALYMDAVNASQQQYKQQAELNAARIKGITAARANEMTTSQLLKVQSRTTWSGLQVLAVVTFVILLFLYNSVFANDKRMFWVITTLLVCMLIWKFVTIVKQDGGFAIGHLSS